MRTLVLGGYGNFGARICRALVAEPSVQLLVGGRDLSRAKALADELGHGSQPVAIDHASEDFSSTLRGLGVELLVHTAGPFQQQGYGVARAAGAAGIHYIDLADGRRFVCDFPAAMNAAFEDAGCSAVTGASTVPALSSAVIDHLCEGWRRIDSIDTCIAPAQTAPRGEATMAAVLSYCGESIQVWEDGGWQPRRGWAKPERVRISGLRDRLWCLVRHPRSRALSGTLRCQAKRNVSCRCGSQICATRICTAGGSSSSGRYQAPRPLGRPPESRRPPAELHGLVPWRHGRQGRRHRRVRCAIPAFMAHRCRR